KAGGIAARFQADVSRKEEVERLIGEVTGRFGGVDVLVNNAGIVHKDCLENITEADWDHVLDVNLKSAFLVTQACLPYMRGNQWGRIINISSVAALTGGVTGPVYVASKAGMLGLARSYAAMLIGEGITANSIAPALIDTDMVSSLNITPEKIPLGRFGKVDEVADIASLLVQNAYVTGQTIHTNGGWYFT
ncbi:MAG: SDR family oxidoreductase, partial [Saprospiraceae bacterium]|nr:SDR family oxidoreductase [Saprospiraceae bacterium]